MPPDWKNRVGPKAQKGFSSRDRFSEWREPLRTKGLFKLRVVNASTESVTKQPRTRNIVATRSEMKSGVWRSQAKGKGDFFISRRTLTVLPKKGEGDFKQEGVCEFLEK